MSEHGKDAAPLRVFFSYSHEDRKMRARLDKALSTLKNTGRIESWFDGEIPPGSDWNEEISEQLASASIILLLVSDNFLSSRFCYRVELEAALERHRAGTARVIPIILNESDWRDGRLDKLKALPTDGKPITSWAKRDKAWADVAKGIRAVVEGLSPGPPAGSPDPLMVTQDSLAADAVDHGLIGDLAVKLCDRKYQDQEFGFQFSEVRHKHPGAPQIYFLPGEAGEAHESFVERICRKKIADLVPELAGERTAAPLLCTPRFPQDGSLDRRWWYLMDELFRSFRPALPLTDPTRPSAALIKKHERLRNRHVVIRHNIIAANWDPCTTELLERYLRFWREANDGTSCPQLIVFMNVVYEPGQANPRFALLRRFAGMAPVPDVSTIGQELERLAALCREESCPAFVLPDLWCLTPYEVKEWFTEFAPHLSATRRRAVLQTIYGESPDERACTHMEDIEHVLAGSLNLDSRTT